jgi:hypothetical protein
MKKHFRKPYNRDEKHFRQPYSRDEKTFQIAVQQR